MSSAVLHDLYSARLDALEETWRVWAEVGRGLTDDEWTAPTRCAGWDVAAVYAHHSPAPWFMSTSPPGEPPAGEPVSAAEILRRFNAPDGVAHRMAAEIAEREVAEAAAHTREELVERFTVYGPRALGWLREADPSRVFEWPASGAVITLVEALRMVQMEATVHLLDVLHALGRPPTAQVPTQALTETALLLAEVAPPVELIEAATGRSTTSPLPVLR